MVNVAAPAVVKAWLPAVQVVHTPAVHALDAPHVVPSATLVPVSTHTGAPELQLMRPAWQALVGVHDAPSLQATQLPAGEQTWLVPHGVPAGAFTGFWQVGAPPEQLMEPTRQVPAVHICPLTHATHWPEALHTPASHTVPGFSGPWPWQTGAPLEQLSAPFWHATPVEQLTPLAQATHVPDGLHTPPSHAVPGAAVPVAWHTPVPLAQEMAPWRHTWPGVHAAPALQPVQVPAPSQKPPPHAAPASTTSTETQVGMPVEQSVAPRRHGLTRVHGAPGLQPAQVPLEQKPCAHIEPLGRLPTATQLVVPDEQSVRPCWHGFSSAQARPATHGTMQMPFSQRVLVGHTTPRQVVSKHAPLRQMEPMGHGAPPQASGSHSPP
jgi:hypothetical protein